MRTRVNAHAHARTLARAHTNHDTNHVVLMLLRSERGCREPRPCAGRGDRGPRHRSRAGPRARATSRAATCLCAGSVGARWERTRTVAKPRVTRVASTPQYITSPKSGVAQRRRTSPSPNANKFIKVLSRHRPYHHSVWGSPALLAYGALQKDSS